MPDNPFLKGIPNTFSTRFNRYILFQEKTALLKRGLHTDDTGTNGNGKIHMHSSESQQEFFRLLDEKIEKGPDYCSEEARV